MPQKNDKLKLDGSISTDDFKNVLKSDDERHDPGAVGGGDVVESDGARFVLVEKVREDGIPYQEQVLVDLLEGDEKILHEESGANANAHREPHATVSGSARGLEPEKQSSGKKGE